MPGIFDRLRGREVNDVECERFVKFNGRSIEISGVDIAGIKLGKVAVETTKLLQTVSQALLILDYYQYDLCKSIKNIHDKNTRDDYVKKITDVKLKAYNIYHTIVALSMNPQSPQMQHTLQQILLSSQKEAIDIEQNFDVLSRVQREEPSIIDDRNSIEIGNTSLKEKVDELKQSFPQNEEHQTSESSQPPVSGTMKDTMNDKNRELEAVKRSLLILNEEYNRTLLKGLNIQELWSKLAVTIQQLTNDSKYTKMISGDNTAALEGFRIKISDKVSEYQQAYYIGNETKAGNAKKEALLYMNQAIRKIDEIFSDA